MAVTDSPFVWCGMVTTGRAGRPKAATVMGRRMATVTVGGTVVMVVTGAEAP